MKRAFVKGRSPVPIVVATFNLLEKMSIVLELLLILMLTA